jgi:hypothetical protein
MYTLGDSASAFRPPQPVASSARSPVNGRRGCQRNRALPCRLAQPRPVQRIRQLVVRGLHPAGLFRSLRNTTHVAHARLGLPFVRARYGWRERGMQPSGTDPSAARDHNRPCIVGNSACGTPLNARGCRPASMRVTDAAPSPPRCRASTADRVPPCGGRYGTAWRPESLQRSVRVRRLSPRSGKPPERTANRPAVMAQPRFKSRGGTHMSRSTTPRAPGAFPSTGSS